MSWALYGLAVAIALVGSAWADRNAGAGGAIAAFSFAALCIAAAVVLRVWGVG